MGPSGRKALRGPPWCRGSCVTAPTRRTVGELVAAMEDHPLFRWERWPWRERLVRWVGPVANLMAVFSRVLQLPSFPGVTADVRWLADLHAKLGFLPRAILPPVFEMQAYYERYGYSLAQVRALWGLRLAYALLEASVFLVYAVAFLVRVPPRSVARGFMETLFPLGVAVMPFLIFMTPYNFHEWFPRETVTHFAAITAITAAMVAGITLNIVGLVTLRRAFTIVTEARHLVRSGPYRWVRHPVYASHFVVFGCATLLHHHPLGVAIYVLWAVFAVIRARREERKLAAVFPEYADYRRTTGMFIPW